jgi:release factor glutamine methyltransferase
MKVFEAVVEAVELLEHASVANSRLDAERLLASQLGVNRSFLLAHFQDTIAADHLENFFSKVRARAEGRPLQHLLGVQEFCGLTFEVTPDVLIPRPETELLVEEAVRRFTMPELRIVDVGTGSGCIAVSVAVALPGAELWAIDLSPAALAVAARNAVRHCVSERIRFHCGDLLSPLDSADLHGKIDGIASNPPYVADNDLVTLQREVRDWEPRIALTGGPSGLSIYTQLIPQAFRFLKPGGSLLLEIGYNMRDSVVNLFDERWVLEKVREDFSGVPRVIIASKK